jgi:hypothetical protein
LTLQVVVFNKVVSKKASLHAIIKMEGRDEQDWEVLQSVYDPELPGIFRLDGEI